MNREEIKEWIKTIVTSIIIAMFIVTFIARPTIVRMDSMYPTLHQYDYLILEKISYRFSEPKREDIIVFKSPIEEADGTNLNLIKRVIGVEGDHIVVNDGDVYLNGEKLEEDYINVETPGEVDITVPDNHVFVMGDNRPVSLDSRDDRIGPIGEDRIMGKVLVRLYPFNKIGKVN